ncbi:hypothetical protein GCM10011504_53990 [Siccirubricoccus deserti]|uniref:DUF3489 domain-containing protein n=1 Tax=Siccirubricoccus deserti TaxID=2013562 RepID=A0A9X0UK82_9PROT|nr:DUF3489 domain-containing protein [Siccirubricoccus deserti]MBC4018895.1 DUF3489 domain-containing protein [Siccirubricoccus deserti]GGC69310.1 hypothetical protein GCM10011504_53990 [Siccirubricoccus deserti]
MTLSDTARRILSAAATHTLGLAAPLAALPAAARDAVRRSLLKQGLVAECAAPAEQISLGWRLPDGAWTAMQITEAGRQAVAAEAPAETMPATASSESPAAATPGPVGDSGEAAEAAGSPSTSQHGALGRPELRAAAQALLAAWDANDGLGLAAAMEALRAAMPRRPTLACTVGPRQGTKQEAVLTLLRRREGATLAQIAEATGWANHTVRGFFAGLKKRGIAVEVLERVRQVGPNKQGTKGSYSVYRIAEAG